MDSGTPASMVSGGLSGPFTELNNDPREESSRASRHVLQRTGMCYSENQVVS